MKTIYYLLIPLLISLTSIQLNAQTEECNCFENNYDITPQGVFFWQAAWFTYYGINPQTHREANQIEFSGENVSYFLNSEEVERPAGFRLYYGLSSLSDTVPMLVMVPIDNGCNDVFSANESKQVLVSTRNSEYFCSADSAAFFTENWQEYNTINEKIETYINAYNYGKDVIQDLLTPDENGNSGLTFEFGLRTIAPQEVCFGAPQGNYGSIIYCNLVYGMNSDTTDGDDRMDFAMPCPQLCDSNGSPLINQ